MFKRQYSSLPDLAELGKIEGVVNIDAPPPGPVQSAPTGVTCVVGECEDGAFATDPAVNPFKYLPDGGLVEILNGGFLQKIGGLGFTVGSSKYLYACARMSQGERWNGNIYVQIKGLSFRRLFIARVDTSLGSVSFSPLAFAEGSVAGPWAVSTGTTIVVSVNGAGNVTATFTAVAAIVSCAAGTLAMVAGDYVDIAIDGGATVRTTFLTGDTTVAAVVARINAAFGSTIASNNAGQVRFTSPTLGTASSVNIIGGSTGVVVTKLGTTVANTAGTGNVARASAVTFAEVKTILEAALTGTVVRQTVAGRVRICSATGSTGTINVSGTSTALAVFGLASGTTITATSGVLVTSIPAGTVCSVSGATAVVTMQSIIVPAGSTGALTVKVRAALDDGSFAGLSASTINRIETTPSPTSEWTVTNANAITAALTEAQKDAAYLAAINYTKALRQETKIIDQIVSARQSPATRLTLVQNATDATAGGLTGRRAFIAPPLGSSITTLTQATAPGVAAYRGERVRYCTGWRKYISEIDEIKSAVGGLGFTDDGLIETHGDIVAASIASILPPEENPAQETEIVPREVYRAPESALAAWGMDEYALCKSNGIQASVLGEDGWPCIQSGVSTVDPIANPTQAPAYRVQFADYLIASVTKFETPFVKRNPTVDRLNALVSGLETFFGDMKGVRLENYSVAAPAKIGPRIYAFDWSVQMYQSMDVLVNRTQISDLGFITPRA